MKKFFSLHTEEEKVPKNELHSREAGIVFGIAKEKEYLLENLSFMISSGMPIAEALRAIESAIRSRFMKKIVTQAREDVENGWPLSRALEATGLFGMYAISLVRTGEESGTLPGNLRMIADQDAKNRLFKSRLRSALMYPGLILLVSFVVGLGVAWFILPKLAAMFSQLRIHLPLITRIFISVGKILNDYGGFILPGAIIGIGLAVYFLFYFPKTRMAGQYLLFSIPGIKKLIEELEISRFGYLLGTLNNAGLPLLQAIGSLKESTLSPFYKKFYEHLYSQIENGHSFQQSFASYSDIREILPTSIQQIVVTGEQSGNLTPALLKIGVVYEDKTEITSKNISVALEPLLLVIVWVGVMLVAVAVILPIYSLVGGITN